MNPPTERSLNYVFHLRVVLYVPMYGVSGTSTEVDQTMVPLMAKHHRDLIYPRKTPDLLIGRSTVTEIQTTIALVVNCGLSPESRPSFTHLRFTA